MDVILKTRKFQVCTVEGQPTGKTGLAVYTEPHFRPAYSIKQSLAEIMKAVFQQATGHPSSSDSANLDNLQPMAWAAIPDNEIAQAEKNLREKLQTLNSLFECRR